MTTRNKINESEGQSQLEQWVGEFRDRQSPLPVAGKSRKASGMDEFALPRGADRLRAGPVAQATHASTVV